MLCIYCVCMEEGVVLPQRRPACFPTASVQPLQCCASELFPCSWVPGRSKRSFLHPESTWGVSVVCGYHSCLLPRRLWVGDLRRSFYVAFECILACMNFEWDVSCPTERRLLPPPPSSSCSTSALTKDSLCFFLPLEKSSVKMTGLVHCTILFLGAKIRSFLGSWTETILRRFFCFGFFFRSSLVQFAVYVPFVCSTSVPLSRCLTSGCWWMIPKIVDVQ